LRCGVCRSLICATKYQEWQQKYSKKSRISKIRMATNYEKLRLESASTFFWFNSKYCALWSTDITLNICQTKEHFAQTNQHVKVYMRLTNALICSAIRESWVTWRIGLVGTKFLMASHAKEGTSWPSRLQFGLEVNNFTSDSDLHRNGLREFILKRWGREKNYRAEIVHIVSQRRPGSLDESRLIDFNLELCRGKMGVQFNIFLGDLVTY